MRSNAKDACSACQDERKKFIGTDKKYVVSACVHATPEQGAVCEACGDAHDGSFGTGRFCNGICASSKKTIYPPGVGNK